MNQEKQQLFKDWDGVTKFYIWDAGYLWIEVDPGDDTACEDSKNRFQPIKRMIVENIKQDKLIAYFSWGNKVYTHQDFMEEFTVGTPQRRMFVWSRVFIDRNDLRRFAEGINEAPLFLFPEKRLVIGNDSSSIEDYISRLKIWCENDIEIIIQEQGKKPRTFSHESLGCREIDTLEWLTLQKIIKSPNLRFKYRDNPASEKKLLQRVEDKVKVLLTKEFEIKFPVGFKLYSPLGGGEFEFKFKSKNYHETIQNDFEKYTDKQLKMELRERSRLGGRVEDYFDVFTELQKRGVSDSELESIIQFDSLANLDQQKVDTHENRPQDE
jgi:hypothetical protein